MWWKKHKQMNKNRVRCHNSGGCMYDNNSGKGFQSLSNGNGNSHIDRFSIAPLLRTIPEDHASTLAIIYRSELNYLSRFIADYPHCETGGHLFGYWTAQGVPVILYVTGPGPNCMHGNVVCEHDHDYYNRIRNTLENKIALQHIGDWHSHHQLCLNHPSGGDVDAVLAGVGNERGMLRRHVMCIGTYNNGQTFVDAYTFHQNDIPDYTHAAWTIIEMESPFRSVSDSLLRGFLINPRTQNPNMGQLYTFNQLVDEALNDSYEQGTKLYWLDDSSDNRKLLKKFVAETKYLHPGKKVEVLATEDNHLFFSIGDGEQSILFTEPFPQGAPYYFNGDTILQLDIPWNYNECTLDECFSNWLFQVVNSITNVQEVSQKKEEQALNSANGYISPSVELDQGLTPGDSSQPPNS